MTQGDTALGACGAEPVVLVVEDDRICRAFCVSVLRQEGFEVVAAADARHGLRLLAAAAPRVVVSDLQLPDPPEREALFTGCRPGHGRTAPALIVMTAHDGPAGRQLARTHGPRAVLFKPFTPPELVAAVRHALGRHAEAHCQAVREEGLPGPVDLRHLFRAGLAAELERLGELVATLQWSTAIDALHRLEGGSALSGHGLFADHCRRFAAHLGPAGPGDGWADRYLELLRLGEDIMDQGSRLRRSG